MGIARAKPLGVFVSSPFETFIEDLAKSSAGEMTQVLKSMAYTSGWPQEAVEALSVVEKNGDLSIQITDGSESLVHELEYGTYEKTPNPVLRKFKAELPKLLEPFIIKEFSSKAGNMVEAL